MSETAARPRPLKMTRYILLGLLLCALVGGVCFLGGRMSAGADRGEPSVDTVVLEQRLSQISELATVSYHYTNMAQFESSNDFYGVKIPFTTKRFILTYDGVIKAGIDLSKARVKVSGSGVAVTLPPAAVLSHELEAESVEIFDEKTSIFNPFTVEDFSSFQADQVKNMEEKALDKGLLDQAREEAVETVRSLLTPLLPEDCILTIN